MHSALQRDVRIIPVGSLDCYAMPNTHRHRYMSLDSIPMQCYFTRLIRLQPAVTYLALPSHSHNQLLQRDATKRLQQICISFSRKVGCCSFQPLALEGCHVVRFSSSLFQPIPS
eukprot:GHRR01009652.1.p2 GENE.GHRR01009652.1~~GHRR01009652.1.p2  ORF type:complete len:114 (+),score=14.09 GHRR01009652.1:947-1288(+)